MVKGESLSYLPGHHLRRAVAPVSGYVVDTATGCWDWQLKLDRAGYGRTKRDGRDLHAHRCFYEDRHGPIPAGLEIDHLCRNPRCVNPDHLEAVTPTENKRRSDATKLSKTEVLAIRESPLRNLELAHIYSVDPSNISHIRAGRSWADV